MSSSLDPCEPDRVTYRGAPPARLTYRPIPIATLDLAHKLMGDEFVRAWNDRYVMHTRKDA